jgi:hypothetical protein
MESFLINAGIVAGSLGLFGAAYGLALLATRPARPRPAPATPDLGDEPPAVVSMLSNRWRLTEDAAESTLLDLAARRFIELRQPANDPYHTTIHLRELAAAELATLNPYERRVLERVRGLAVEGVVPVTALTFRNPRQARGWNRRLHHEVVKDTRARGLSRRRFGPLVLTVLTVVALQASAGLAVAAFRSETSDPDSSPLVGAFWVSIIAFLVLTGIAGRAIGERDTAAGRELAARWLGVREWLRGHEEFADLPPAAVTVWDRYLPYGAALGVTHTASAVLDLGMGDRRLVWSSYGGQWRRVRVRYPKLWRRYGLSLPQLLVRGVLAGAIGYVLVRWHEIPSELAEVAPEVAANAQGFAIASRVGLWLGIGLLVLGGYRLVRTLLDLATTRTITGEVLWVEKWRSRSGGKDRPPVVWLDYLAVDDGNSDRTTAWGRPRAKVPGCNAGDTVTIRVRPWSRRIIDLTVVERGKVVPDAHAEAPDPAPASLAAAALGAVFGKATRDELPGTRIEQLLTLEEVGQALGMAVKPLVRAPLPGLLATATYSSVDRDRPVLMVQRVAGASGRWVARANTRGDALPIGDGASVDGDRAVVRVDEVTVSLMLLGDARQRRDALPGLLERVAARLPRAAQAR